MGGGLSSVDFAPEFGVNPKMISKKGHSLWYLMVGSFVLGFGSSESAAGVTFGAGVLYVPESEEGFSGDPVIGGTPIESGVIYIANGSVPLTDALRIQGEFLWYESETNESRAIAGVGVINGTLDLKGYGGFLNLLYDFGSLLESDWLILEGGVGIGYATFKNTVKTSLGESSSRFSARDEVPGWQVVGNLGYRMNPSVQFGLTARYIRFGDLKWEGNGRSIKATDVHALAAGAYVAYTF